MPAGNILSQHISFLEVICLSVHFKNVPGKLDLWKERGSMAILIKLDLWEGKGLFFMDAALEFSGNLALALRCGLLRCWQIVSLGGMYLDGRDPDQFMA